MLDPDRRMLVRRIFEEFATGEYTLPHITKKTKEWGLLNKTRTKGALGKSHLYKILTNPFYHGTMVVKGKAYPHKYPPIISKETFDQCQQVLKGWNKKPFKYGNREFAFRGLLSCISTGRTVSSFIKKKTYKSGQTGEWIYLQSWDKQGKQIYIREEKILSQAEKALQALSIPSDVVSAVKDYLSDTEHTEREFYRRQNDELKKEDTLLQSRLNGLIDLLIDKAITREEFDTRKLQIKQRQNDISILLNGNREGDHKFKDTMLLLIDICSNVGDLFKSATTEQKRTIMNAVFLNLSLDNESLCFSYKKPFSIFIESAKTGKWSHLVSEFRTNSIILEELSIITTHFLRTGIIPPAIEPII